MSGGEDGVVLDRAQTVQLIRAYGAHRQLWDVADARYFHRAARARAWREIGAALRAPVPDLKRKLVSLMGSYRREKSREKQSVAAGLPPAQAYKSKWYGYQHFGFLADRGPPPSHEPMDQSHDHDHHQPAIDNIKVEVTDYEDEPAEADYKEESPGASPASAGAPASPASPAPPPLGWRGAALAASDVLHDEFVTFGLYVANELRKYDAVTLAHAKRAINGVLFDADLGRLPPPPPPAPGRD